MSNVALVSTRWNDIRERRAQKVELLVKGTLWTSMITRGAGTYRFPENSENSSSLNPYQVVEKLLEAQIDFGMTPKSPIYEFGRSFSDIWKAQGLKNKIGPAFKNLNSGIGELEDWIQDGAGGARNKKLAEDELAGLVEQLEDLIGIEPPMARSWWRFWPW